MDVGSMLKWYLVTEGHLLIYVSFLCSRDYLQITNEMNRVFGKYCAHMTGKTLLVSGKYALIKFHSNRTIQNRGFLISFTYCKKWELNGFQALIIVILTLRRVMTQKVDNSRTIIKSKLTKTSRWVSAWGGRGAIRPRQIVLLNVEYYATSTARNFAKTC